MYRNTYVLILSLLIASCLPENKPSGHSIQIPQTDISLPTQLNMRENLLEMRGLTADFTRDTWIQSGLDQHYSWDVSGTYFLIGKLQPVPSGVTAVIILKDSPNESTAWLAAYSDHRLADCIEVFHRTETQSRIVGSNWRNGQLYVRLQKEEQPYEEVFKIQDNGKLVPYSPGRVPE